MMLRRSQTSAMREATIDTALYTIQKPVDIEAHSTAENKERKHVPYTTKKFLTLRQRNFYIVYILSILGIAIIFIAATSSIKRFTRSQSQKYINESVEPQRKGSALPWPESLNLIENKTVSPLGEYDYRYFTIRLNTWHRNEQLIASLDHHSQCEGVAQIQVIWCDNYNDPPHYVIHHPSGKVVVERHSVNSLNERFNMLLEPTTAGILSMDDDVIRPCFAIDAGFFRWTEAPKRMLGFDNRVHEIKGKQWSYGYLSTSEKRNEYSMTLPRYAFMHRDYLRLYQILIPEPIYDTVQKETNCEDIAMSFFISALTGGKVPLLADYWAIKTQVKLSSGKMISSSTNHKSIRDQCVDIFAELLHLKDTLKAVKAKHRSIFEYGQLIDSRHSLRNYHDNSRKVDYLEKLAIFNDETMPKEIHRMKKIASKWVADKGLLNNKR